MDELRSILRIIYEEKDKDGLHAFIYDVFGVDIPRTKCCSDHDAPFDFVAESFFDIYQFVLALANRNGGKTLDFSILDALNSYAKDNCETATVAALKAQADKCYRYFTDWTQNISIFAEAVVNTTRNRTDFDNSSSVQILTGTAKGVNAPHPNKALIDEVELWEWSILMEAFSMAHTSNGNTGQTILTSTRKYASGVMDRLLEESERRGIKVYKWCIWEVVEPYDNATPEQKEEIEQFAKDPVFGMPPAVRTKKDGFYSWTDLLAKYKQLDPEIWQAQWTCQKPERSGLMYPQFNIMPYPEGNMRRWDYTKRLPLYLFEDYGYGQGHPDVILFVQINWDLRRMYVFREIRKTNCVSSEMAAFVCEMLNSLGLDCKKTTDENGQERYNFSDFITGWIGDPAGLSEHKEREQMGAPMLDKLPQREYYFIKNGASIIRRMLLDHRILIDPDHCKGLVEEMHLYSKIKLPNGEFSSEPKKKNDHGPDALRYGTVRLFPVDAAGSFGIEYDNINSKENSPILGSLFDKDF